MLKLHPVVCVVLLLVCACSLDYEDAIVSEEMLESIPDTILYKLEHNLVRDGKIIATLEADYAEQFEKKSETYLESIHFREFDSEGEIVNEVFAEAALYHSDTENAEAMGELYINSIREEAEMFAQNLTWKKEERLLIGIPDEQVLLRKDDGSELAGYGFRADFRHKEIEFRGSARGTFVYEEEDTSPRE